MTHLSPWLLLATSVGSGLLGALLTAWWHARRETRRFKIDTLKRFAGWRHNLRSDAFMQTLNEVVVVFNDDKQVMAALQEYHSLTVADQGQAARDGALVKLYKAMCRASGIDVADFNDAFFFQPFTPRQ